ncbi:MAG: cysteine--tRNA ligase [Planctomycetaceae bacterium]|nr:cysteine--tRNA ligase [Planctomycetaceae bacterium]
MLRVYNTLTKTKEEFKTVEPDKVGMYTCGPTVYKPSHIGHFVGPVIFDAVKRYLTYSGYTVKWIINITDVDDKLINESKATGRSVQAIAEEMTADYWTNLEAMGVKESVFAFPKVSDHIPQIINFITVLINKGFAYVSDGDVYFDVGAFPDYGKLSHRSLDAMNGEGGSTAAKKHTPFDFALWKAAKEPDEMAWDSPWGRGRPGWHIECSVMSSCLLGETFDIHGGGLDLQFPHHENEVAQSEARFGKPMCHYWMHNGLMQASSETGKLGGRNTKSGDDPYYSANPTADQEANKISKSKGASAFRDMLKIYSPELIRFFILSTHYRRPIDYSEERLAEVGKGLDGFYRFFKRFEQITGKSFYALTYVSRRGTSPQADGANNEIIGLKEKFLSFMDDDFNTGGAVGVQFDLLRELNRLAADSAAQQDLLSGAAVLRELSATLGLFIKQQNEPDCANPADEGLVNNLMTLLIELRAAARKNKDFATADKIRKDLTTYGITLTDTPQGTEWNVA